ncbi:MAG: hypothetical protein AVDCRST_MAG56-2684 [uncultured Cytophagales bacterium]|uniref:Glycosyl transferase, group 1 n=1 Tax=uncultured Cytophagales bacterium TaxID=158755 RepID=A0A6J4IWI3_9SPHI|nr:MAG: hypothetical protein AVDCRST_MAG56-2684 [uncultured Cytophagales bacterium]
MLNDQFSGVQYSIENLLRAMGNGGTPSSGSELLLSADYRGSLRDNARFATKKVDFSTTNRVKRIYYEHFRLPAYFRRHGFDLYHAPGYILPYYARLPSVLTVHDLIALDYPEYCQYETAAYFNLCLPRSIRRADRIIAVSDRVKADILRRFNVEADAIAVIHHGVEKEFKRIVSPDALQRVSRTYGLPEKFLLFVGNLEPKKNLSRLIEAFLHLKRHAGIVHKLVIAGKKGWKYEALFRQLGQQEAAGEVMLTGYVAREDMPAIYSLADLFVFPSLYEGFGLPVLEAMACGTPVLTSTAGALPEITGGLYPQADPLDAGDLARKMHLLLTDAGLREKNVRHGTARAGAFSWEKAARQTLRVYEEVLHGKRAGRRMEDGVI